MAAAWASHVPPDAAAVVRHGRESGDADEAVGTAEASMSRPVHAMS